MFRSAPTTLRLGLIPYPNVETETAVFRQTLSSNATSKLKSYDLVWLLHLVGDIHQPLHCTSRFTSTQPQGDSGGNDVTCLQRRQTRAARKFARLLG